jgi:uncharacterized protein (UPF0332 family)/predicted nucleotidyltransferase
MPRGNAVTKTPKRKKTAQKELSIRENRAPYPARRGDVLAHLRENERAALADYVARLREKFPQHVRRVVLFGSKARGDADDESDLDLLIVVNQPNEDVNKKMAQERLDVELARNVIFGGVTMTVEEFTWNRVHHSPIYRSIVSEGINLLGKTPRRISARAIPAIFQPPNRSFQMGENAKLMIKIRFDDGKEDLAVARKNLQDGFYRAAISRAYYAVFAISTAILLTMDLVRAKHSGVQSAFHQYFIKERRLEEEYGDIFDKSRTYREGADYKSWRFTEEKAGQAVADCEKLFARMERYLREVGALD